MYCLGAIPYSPGYVPRLLVSDIFLLPHLGQRLIVTSPTFLCFNPLSTSRKSASIPILFLSSTIEVQHLLLGSPDG